MARRGVLFTVAAATLLLVVFATGTVIAQDTGDETPTVHACAADPGGEPPDGNDTIGWFDGQWYNDTLGVNETDELNRTELETFTDRTAARVEALRCLPFQERPSIQIISREEFANQTATQFEVIDNDSRYFDNAMLETMLLIGSETDAVDVQEESRSVTVGGYYNFVENHIVIVANDSDAISIDETVLAHELHHALQDQHFDLTQYERRTTDQYRGTLGVIEGDAQRLQYRYQDRCEADAWGEPCLEPDEAGDGSDPPNWGLYFWQFQPYSDGPAFIEYFYESDGWEGVNELYADVPNSTMYSIEPERYGSVRKVDVSLVDHSSDEWERIYPQGSPGYDEIGQAGLSAMFIDPAYDNDNPFEGPVVTADDFLNTDGNRVDPENPINYDLSMTDGWRGDRFHAFRNGNDTATVWKLAWADTREQQEFRLAYESLIEYRGGTTVPEYEHTWRFDEDGEFNQTVTLYPMDDELLIVTAPTVSDIPDVHEESVLIENRSTSNNETNGDDGTDDGGRADTTYPFDDDTDIGQTDDTDGDDELPETPIPGFGPLVAIAALATGYVFLQKYIS